MPQFTHRYDSISKGILSLFACILLAGGLASCNNSSNSGSNNESQTAATLTLTPSTISLTAGAAGQQASLMLAAPAGAGAATVTVSGLPTGVTITPSTLSATPGTALPLVFTAASSATATTAMVTFTTTVNGQATTTQASLTVQAATQATPDFTLSATPATVSLTANGTPATISLLATAQNGFSANVQVTIAGLPAGVTAQPSTITLTPGTAATLTLTAPVGTAAGSSTVMLTGTSGSLTHTASVAVTVIAPPPAQADFSLAVTPASLSLTVGGPGNRSSSRQRAQRVYRERQRCAQRVTRRCDRQPSHAFAYPGTPQSVTLTAGNSAQPGSASVVFTGTSGSLSHTAALALTVAASAGVNVTTYHNDNARDGWNASETTLTPQNVNFNALASFVS